MTITSVSLCIFSVRIGVSAKLFCWFSIKILNIVNTAQLDTLDALQGLNEMAGDTLNLAHVSLHAKFPRKVWA